MSKPQSRVLETDLNVQFSARGKDPIARILWYLWEDKDIFNKFVDEFMVKKCQVTPEQYEQDPTRLDEFLEMIVHRCFVDLTSQI